MGEGGYHSSAFVEKWEVRCGESCVLVVGIAEAEMSKHGWQPRWCAFHQIYRQQF
jgi:hypothetical protein